MQNQSGVREGSDGVGAGRDGVGKCIGSWREVRDVRAAEAATPKHWASIERRRKRQTTHEDKDKDKRRSSKRTRQAVAQRLRASLSLEPSTPAPVSVLTAPETPEPPPVVRRPVFGAPVGRAALPTQKLEFEAIELEAAAANPVEPSVPASVSVPHCPWIPHRRR
jgi:hypothetical protein